MPLSQTVAPTTEPLTTAEAKAQLRLEHSNDDDRISNFLLPAARQMAEDYTRRAFVTQTFVLTLDDFGSRPIYLPRPPLSSFTSAVYIADDGTSTTWSSSNYTVITPSGDNALHSILVPAYRQVFPTTRAVVEAVTLTYVAGWGSAASAVPEAVKAAVGLYCQWLYDDADNENLKAAAELILGPYIAPHEDLRFG